MSKLPYKLVTLAVSVSGGLLAGAVFKWLWKLATGQDEAPKATDADRRWHEVLLAATAQGAVIALVKAVLDRGAAQVTHKLTGTWPGEPDDASARAEDKAAGRGKG